MKITLQSTFPNPKEKMLLVPIFLNFIAFVVTASHMYPATCPENFFPMGKRCYAPCPQGWSVKHLYCAQDCPKGYRDDGLTCWKDVKIIPADRHGCHWYDLCGLGHQCTTCPDGMKNDGCTCRKDAHMIPQVRTLRETAPYICSEGGSADKNGICHVGLA